MNRVHIEIQRVQTWLFAVPRLRAMVGANTLLGEVLRNKLPELARRQTNWKLAQVSGAYPSKAPDDPLADHDDPAADARDGIIARDGGHFEAFFASGASAFVEAAVVLLRRNLPGLRFRISVDGVAQDAKGANLSTELPVLAPCEWIGRGLASVEIRQGTERASVSLDVSRRHEAARRSENGHARDLASLLAQKTHLRELPRAGTFQSLAGRGYLAMVHADGNGVGRDEEMSDNYEIDPAMVHADGNGVGGAAGSGDVERAAFYHRNRVLLRRALQAAIDAACEGATSATVLPLMLGGDDLLVVCRADAAFPFVATLCQALADIQQKGRSDFDLTLGIGVVFARPTVPIHRLHEVVEQLAASAKRRYRGFADGEGRSVVDWAVYTTSWVADPEEARRRDWLRGCGEDKRVLSQRPVDVLGDGLSSLQGLLQGAAALEGAPRSQLRYLIDQLPRGRALSDLAFAELSKEARSALDRAGVANTLWVKPDPNGPLLTAVLDLVEIYEIRRLGRAVTVTVEPETVEDEEEVPHVQE